MCRSSKNFWEDGIWKKKLSKRGIELIELLQIFENVSELFLTIETNSSKIEVKSMEMFIPKNGTKIRLEEDWTFKEDLHKKVKNDLPDHLYEESESGNIDSVTIPKGNWIEVKDFNFSRSDQQSNSVSFCIEVSDDSEDFKKIKSLEVSLPNFNRIQYDEVDGDVPESKSSKFKYFTVEHSEWSGTSSVNRLHETFEKAVESLCRNKRVQQIRKVNSNFGVPDNGRFFNKDAHEVVEDVSDDSMNCGRFSLLKRPKAKFGEWSRNVPLSLDFLKDCADSFYVIEHQGRDHAKPFVVIKHDGDWIMRMNLPLFNEGIGDWNKPFKRCDRLKDAVEIASEFVEDNWKEYGEFLDDELLDHRSRSEENSSLFL
jgi:hypothetical protein